MRAAGGAGDQHLKKPLLIQTQTVGILSYIDPVEAVLLSAFFLREPVTAQTVIGAVMILGAAAVSELAPAEKST